MVFGKQNEGKAREAFLDFGRAKGLFTTLYPESMWVHPQYDWLSATPDAIGDDDSVVDFKCPTIHFPEEVPVHHDIQGRIQMACAEKSRFHYFAWRENGPYFYRCILRDMAKESILVQELQAFYRNHIAVGEPPPRRAKRCPA